MTAQTWPFSGVFYWNAAGHYPVRSAIRVYTQPRYADAFCKRQPDNVVTRTITARDFYGFALDAYAQGCAAIDPGFYED
jgi:hypothetical protein